MTFARILSVAAVAVFASVGVQAGDLYGAGFDTQAPSTLSRAEVHAQAVQAVAQFKNYEAVDADMATPSTLVRSEVRSQAVAANRAGAIATGDRS
ncbi:MAG: DUF4148 domain-containing protein [Burkholderiales bacterium]|nr:DUF4148 domain-containing protein [Burkholderiales bacterium]